MWVNSGKETSKRNTVHMQQHDERMFHPCEYVSERRKHEEPTGGCYTFNADNFCIKMKLLLRKAFTSFAPDIGDSRENA